MSIKDARARLSGEQPNEALTPKPVFLVLAGLTAAAAVLLYLNEDLFVDPVDRSTSHAYALSLVLLILMGGFFLVCYRSPALGNRLLGYAGLMRGKSRSVERESDGSVQFFRTSAVDDALGEKRRSTRRKTARHQRRQMAAATRAMQTARTKDQSDNEREEPNADESADRAT